MRTNNPGLSIAGIALLLVSLCAPIRAAANPSESSVCEPAADYFLVAENYPEAIRLHRDFLRKHPANALAHYHTGFAQGMVGDRAEELREYRRAAALGLSRWDLFLNTGLALLERGDLAGATDALRLAVHLGPNRPEAHFNLGLVYERRDMLAEAEHEMLAALRLEPELLDARNMLGVIYARQGKLAQAAVQWRNLLSDAPDFGAARTNLMLLGGQRQPVPSEHKEARGYSRPFKNSQVVR